MNASVNEPKKCPNCGKAMPAGALEGFCPACLLAQGEGEATPEQGFVPPSPGEVARLFPQLEILGLLGAGGMGAVYKARQPALDRLVALKILPAKSADGGSFEERFNREARALARLSHPNIVAVHEFGHASGLHFFIMEFVDGANLRQLEQTSRLSPREALQIIPQICDALQYAHDEGVVHRDIKPENVLVDRKGRVKIADFGLAKILGQDAEALRLTAEGQVMGTPHYMAPEQVERPLSVDHRADIYSLGVVFYEMLTGDLPLGKFSAPSLKAQVDVRLDEVVLRALENDPSRRYQKASEVKERVETIAGTPSPVEAPAADPEAQQESVWWAGFPVVVESRGSRKVNRKGALQAFGIVFGLLTIAFGVVSIFTGHSLFGWVGIAGAPSLFMRVVLAALVVGRGVWRSLRRPASPPPGGKGPQTPQGTTILPPEGFSRKAVIGVCWAPLFFIMALLWFVVVHVEVKPAGTDAPEHALQWWQILLNVTLLPLGLTAPFGTTILGWLAVGDIRRGGWRLSGLGLAVFDGLLFPLLALDAFLAWVWVEGLPLRGVLVTVLGGSESLRAFTVAGAVGICALADFLIVWMVWRSVKPGGGSVRGGGGGWWWSSKRGVIVILVLCVLVISAAARRNSDRNVFKGPAQQIAERDPATGVIAARLPTGGTVELLAISDEDAPANAWWRPDGTPIPDMLFETEGINRSTVPDLKVRDIILRSRDLPTGASGASMQIEPAPNGWTGGGRVLRDGRALAGGWVDRVGLRGDPRTATLRAGFGLEAWQTVSSHSPNGNATAYPAPRNAPRRQPLVHQITESKGEAVLTLVMEREDENWMVRVIAVDTNDLEHEGATNAGTPGEKTSVWTYSFNKLPLARLKEFRVQVRPVHWVEFRGVALDPRDRTLVGQSTRTFKPTCFGEAKEVEVTELFDFDAGIAGVFPTAKDGTQSDAGIERNPSWIVRHGFDVDAGTNELRLAQLQIIDLKSGEWDTLTGADLVDRINRSHYAPPRLPSTPDAKPPLTHGFRTRQGSFGLLQVTGFEQDNARVRLRYKLMERAHLE